MPESVPNRLRIKFDWKASALVILLMPLLLTLGFWQLDRADEKLSLQTLFDERLSSEPVALVDVKDISDLRFVRVKVQGQFINEKTLFLDNRIFQGQFGYDVVTPFSISNSGQVVFINRGWVKGDISRRTLPTIEPVVGSVELVGQVYVPHSEMLVLDKLTASGWPKVMQSFNVEMLEGDFESTLFPYSIRLEERSPGFLISSWRVVNLQPEKHTGYAVQWFAMSLTLVIIGFLANTNVWALVKARNESN